MGEFDYEVECPSCGAVFTVPSIRLGRQEVCPVCRTVVLVGDAAAETAEAAEAMPAPEPELELQAPVAAVPPALADFDRSAPSFVCCVREQKVNPIAVGPVVREFTGQPLPDARRQIAKGKGILAEGLSLDTARSMVDTLGSKGVEAFAFPAEAVPAVEKELSAQLIYGADERALHIQVDVDGTVKSVQWEALAAGICTREQFFRGGALSAHTDERETIYIPTRYGVAIEHRIKHEPREREADLRITLVLQDRSGHVYVLPFDERHVRYAYLEDRLRPGLRQNLSLFLVDVLNWGGRAFFPEGFRAAAHGQFGRVTNVVGKLDSDNYLRWVLCCAAARGRFSRAAHDR